MRYYIISGEASGDLHASNLVRYIHSLDTKAEVRAWAGDLTEAQGATLVKHYRELAFMGFKEVVANLHTIMRNIDLCKKDISDWKPDVVVYVDYPGFNMRIAAWARQQGYRNVYYISPQLWAWKEGRVKKIRRDLDRMIIILPFERDFYKKHDVKADYVGHPLLDVAEIQKAISLPVDNRPHIALLPGSRRQEIIKMLPVMLEVARRHPEWQFAIAGASAQPEELYRSFSLPGNVSFLHGRTYEVLAGARAALVTSGTATLETALFRVPLVVLYKGSKLSYMIGRQLVKVPFISLVNLVAGRKLVEELIQDQMTPDRVEHELLKLLQEGPEKQAMLQGLDELRHLLGDTGASARAAQIVVEEAVAFAALKKA